MKNDTTLVATAYFSVLSAALTLVAVVEHVMRFGF
jgi:hypothetical protein